MIKTNKLYKVNIHITNRCCFNCKYCFGKPMGKKELDVSQWKVIINSILESNKVNAINFSGGEPFLYKGLEDVVKYAYDCGFNVSVISNGYYFKDKTIVTDNILKYFSTIGISCDSLKSQTAKLIGRCTNNESIISFEDFLKIKQRITNVNKECILKVNTVVNKYNYNEIIAPFFKEIGINKWKILKMKNCANNKDYLPTEKEFNTFVANNKPLFNDNLVLENDMANTYIIINPQGLMLDSTTKEYKIIGNVLKDSFIECFKKFNFNEKEYWKRYK